MKVAAIQMTSGDAMAVNIATFETLVAAAANGGARLVATPENTFYMRREGTVRVADGPVQSHPGVRAAQHAAKQHGVWILVGSIRALEAPFEKAFNRSLFISPEGEISAQYDKIHLFDVTLPDGQEYHESSQARAGNAVVTVALEEITLGLSICYDLRFPALYRALATRGATILAVPSAFTKPTGTAHWEILLRARAIENACYVIAPAQCGIHPGGRETYGHSMIIDPWGRILAQADGTTPQVIFADIDNRMVENVRAQIPVLKHQQPIA